MKEKEQEKNGNTKRKKELKERKSNDRNSNFTPTHAILLNRSLGAHNTSEQKIDAPTFLAIKKKKCQKN
jgi:hypothetical protein